MIPSPRASRTRRCLLAVLAGLASLLSGCVYLRLLEVKRQLGEFDRFFTLETTDGVKLGCLKPVLLTGDLRWLGITPEKIKKLGSAEEWRVRWVKEVPPGVAEKTVRDVEIGLIFTDDKLARLLIEEGYFALIPKPFFVGLLRGLGQADINRSKRDAAVSLAGAGGMELARISEASLLELLGAPSERRVESGRSVLRFRYVPTPPGARNGVFDLSFTFNPAGQLVFLQGRSPVGQMSFNFEAPAALR